LKIGNNNDKVFLELLINVKLMIEDLENSKCGLLEIVKEKK
jgi:hypothetical protein